MKAKLIVLQVAKFENVRLGGFKVGMAIDALIRELEKESGLSLEGMRAALEQIPLEHDSIKDYLPDPSPEGDYSRNIIYEQKNLEVVLATWRVAAATEPHNHGIQNTHGMAQVLSGEIFNEVYEAQTDGRLLQVRHETFQTGDYITIPGGLIHRMGNNCKKNNSTTLHIYSPQILDAKYWDTETLQPLILENRL